MNKPESRHPSVPLLPAQYGGVGFEPLARTKLSDKKPPRRPDWLLMLVIGLFLTTLLIAWLVDFPALFR